MGTMIVTYEESVDDNKKPVLTVTSPKHKPKYIIKKSEDGFQFFDITMKPQGQLPQALKGKFSTPESALRCINAYVLQTTTTKRKEMDDRFKERDLENAAKSKPDNKEYVQQGTAD